jgi:hypothetical protein
MQTTQTLQLVERYLEAIAARDFGAARSLLADRGFGYTSPIAHFDDADRFAESMEGVGAILHGIRTRHRFVDDDVVCHVLDVTVSLDGYQTQRVVQLARVEAARIIGLEVIFDASQFHRMIGQGDTR